jgi:Na+/melibiose symporter-like transporter
MDAWLAKERKRNEKRGCETERKRKMKRKTIALAAAFIAAYTRPVSAASEITGKINSIYDLVLGIVTAVGGIVLVWGIFDFATGYQQHDSAQQTASVKKIVAGIIMCAAGALVAILR